MTDQKKRLFSPLFSPSEGPEKGNQGQAEEDHEVGLLEAEKEAEDTPKQLEADTKKDWEDWIKAGK